MAPEGQVATGLNHQGLVNTTLARLGLTAEEIAAVKRQGFVSAEMRGRKCMVFKLRFRIDGRQRVQYLGTDPLVADTVREELRRLQNGKRMDKNLQSLINEANRLLRETKSQLLPFAEAAGYRFHGRALRRTRRSYFAKSDPKNF